MEPTRELLARLGVAEDDLPDQRGIRSVPFEPHLCLAEGSTSEAVVQCTDRLQREWLKSFRRRPGAKKQEQFRACVGLILLNLLRAEARSKGLAVGIGTSKAHLDASRRYVPFYMSVDYFLMARAMMLEQGVMTIASPGYRNDGLAQVARYRLTDAAKDFLLAGAPPLHAYQVDRQRETIILKDNEGRLAKYEDNAQTNKMRDNLARINETIASSRINSTRPLDPEFDLEEGKSSGGTRLYRVFNNGTFEQGGRFYGGWWQYAKRHFRPLITINDEATIEADYKGLHPSILFARQGLPIPPDPYALVPGVDGDADLRHHAKTTFVALLNTSSGRTDEPRFFDSARYGMSGREFQAQVRGAFSMLPNIFSNAVGMHLQREDSDLAERVMLHFVDRGLPILPIHDSFIVAMRHREELVQVMVEAFEQVYGEQLTVTVKG